MTKVNKLILDGFKSFGKRTEFLFSDKFNCVLGPNGSGKSNLLDALCFVLGRTSSKSLRAEKSANLIYNGGKTKNAAKMAEVSIMLDNKSKVFPVEGDEVKVSRFVRQDGMSKYKINNKTKTRQEVLELLSHGKIDPEGYNIIMQGDIVSLVEMSSIERRQIIEEIAGIGVYEERKQKALNELQIVDEKINEAEIILKERETYLKELKKDRDHAHKYKELSDKVKSNKASYAKKRIDKKGKELFSLNERTDKHKERLNKINNDVSNLKSEITSRKNNNTAISNEIEQKGEIEQISLQKDIEQLKISIATDKTKIDNGNNEMSRIAQRKQQMDYSLKELDEKISSLNEEKKSLLNRKKELSDQFNSIESKIKDFRKKHNLDLEFSFDKQLSEIDVKSDELQKDLQSLREKQQELLREKDKNEFQIQTIDGNINKVLELEKEHKQEIDILKKKKEEFKKAVLELNALLNNDSSLAGELSQKKQLVNEKREELNKLELRQSSVRESASLNIGVKKVLENKSKLGEIFGTVAELGKVSSKYALALEIAASQRVHSVVVEDDKTASKCIKFLKENKFGVATFLPLNKIKPHEKQEVDSVLKEKGVIGRAVDLISFDSRFKSVFSYVFGNTLVVDNIETSRRLGIGKYRMVTVDGDLAELSGAMVGGFRQKKISGLFKEEELESSIGSLSDELVKLEKRIDDIDVLRKDHEEKIARLREFKANVEGEIIKTERSLHLDTGDLSASKSYKEELQDKIKNVDNSLKEINSRINEQTKKLTDLKIEKEKVRSQIQDLKKPTLIAELNAFEQKKKELSENIIRLEGEVKNFDMQLSEVHSRDKDNTIKILKELDKEAKEFNDDLKELNKKVTECQAVLKKKEVDQEKFYVQFKSLFDKRNKLNEEINVFEQRVASFEEASRKEELELNGLSIEDARLKAEMAGLETEFSQYGDVPLFEDNSEEDLKKEIAQFERMMDNIGNVNMRALEVYDLAEKEYGILMEKKSGLSVEKESVLKMMEEIELKKKDLFMKSFDEINVQFQTIFKQLSSKGEASLELENLERPFDEGMRIKVKLNGEKFLDIRSLSGGEKTMTALAFIFAIQENEPAYFYIFDEVDAALDKRNSELLAGLVKKYSDKAQYIIISHNDNIISEADTLYGVSMNPELGISSTVSMKL